MKTRTKFIISLLFFAAITGAARAQFKVGFRVAGNVSNVITDQKDHQDKCSDKLGLQGGVTVEYMFSPVAGIQTALLYDEKGYKLKVSDEEKNLAPNGNVNYKFYLVPKLGYIQLPIHGVYKVSVGTDSRITFSAGPYVAYGISGKVLVEDKLTFSGEVSKEERAKAEKNAGEAKAFFETLAKGVDYFKDDGMFTPFDFGAGLALGYEQQRLEVKIGIDMGLINISRDKEKSSFRNRNIYFSLGAKF